MKLGRPQDRISPLKRIYVSGILPDTKKSQIMSYFSSFGRILDVKLFAQGYTQASSPSPWGNGGGGGKHYCILICQDTDSYSAILGWPRHFIQSTRVFCEAYLTGIELIKQNNLNNKKRAFIRKVPFSMDIGRLLDHIERISGPIESYLDYKNDSLHLAKHFSISVTFKTKESRDQFCHYCDIHGLEVHGESVCVEKYSRKKKKTSQVRNTLIEGPGSYQLPGNKNHPVTLEKLASFNSPKNTKIGNSLLQSTLPTSTLSTSKHLDAISFEELWKKPKPTCRGYHIRTFRQFPNDHSHCQIRLNVAKRNPLLLL